VDAIANFPEGFMGGLVSQDLVSQDLVPTAGLPSLRQLRLETLGWVLPSSASGARLHELMQYASCLQYQRAGIRCETLFIVYFDRRYIGQIEHDTITVQ